MEDIKQERVCGRWGRRWSEGEGEGGEGRREGQRCEAESSRSLSDADRDTFAPELWNCVVWNWNGGASGAVICNKFQVLQHFEGSPLPLPSPPFPFPPPKLSLVEFCVSYFLLSYSFHSLLSSSPSPLPLSLSFPLLSSPYMSISYLQTSLPCWYPSGLLSVMSRLDSWRQGLASFPPTSLSHPPLPP